MILELKIKKLFLFIAVAFLIGVAFFSRFYLLDYPREVVFDEFHFFHFVEEYEKGAYFFDIHPPLGKLIFWQVAKYSGIKEYMQTKNNDISEWKIGATYSDKLNIKRIRAVSAFFGAMLIPLVFAILYLLTTSIGISFFGASLVLFDTALLTESQYILMDSMLIFFTMASLFFLLLYQKYKNNKNKAWWLWGGTTFFIAVAVAIKWTGLSALGLAEAILIWNLYHNRKWGNFFRKNIFMLAGISIVYLAVFQIHFYSLPNTGTGDNYHSLEFKASLKNSPYEKTYQPKKFFEKFGELNRVMLDRSASVKNSHPFASKWYQWPVGEKPILFWQKLATKQNLYLFGNSIIWLGSLIFLIIGFSYFLSQFFSKKTSKKIQTLGFLFLAYFANFLPFIFVSRTAFLYHYFNAFVISILIFAITLTIFPQRIQKYFGILFLLSAMAIFLLLSPFAYGTPTDISFPNINFIINKN